MAKIEVIGLDKLEKRLKANATLNDVKKVVRTNGAQLQKKMVANADFTGGYATGTTKHSIGLEINNGGFTAEVGPETEYSPYVEYGTRFMNAQPFARPAFNEQKAQFERDMKKLVR